MQKQVKKKCGFLPPRNAQKDKAMRTQKANTVATLLIDDETGTMTENRLTMMNPGSSNFP